MTNRQFGSGWAVGPRTPGRRDLRPHIRPFWETARGRHSTLVSCVTWARHFPSLWAGPSAHHCCPAWGSAVGEPRSSPHDGGARARGERGDLELRPRPRAVIACPPPPRVGPLTRGTRCRMLPARQAHPVSATGDRLGWRPETLCGAFISNPFQQRRELGRPAVYEWLS